MSQSGRKGASLWDLFQDCFDEIFSSIVPGIIFVSYLVFMVVSSIGPVDKGPQNSIPML